MTPKPPDEPPPASNAPTRPITFFQNIVKILLGRSQSDFIGEAAICRQKLIVRAILILALPLFKKPLALFDKRIADREYRSMVFVQEVHLPTDFSQFGITLLRAPAGFTAVAEASAAAPKNAFMMVLRVGAALRGESPT
jgi:hypothetical protein